MRLFHQLLSHSFYQGGNLWLAYCISLERLSEEQKEEWLVLPSEEETNPHAGIFINRLSDYLFVLARLVNHQNKVAEPLYERGGKVFIPL